MSRSLRHEGGNLSVVHHVGANDTGKMSSCETKLGLLGRSQTDQDLRDCVV